MNAVNPAPALRVNVFERARQNLESLLRGLAAENSAGARERRNIESILGRLGENSAVAGDSKHNLALAQTLEQAAREPDAVKRAILFADVRAMLDASDSEKLPAAECEQLRVEATKEQDPFDRALLHQRAQRRA